MTSTSDQLAWEARQRPRAGIAAILAGLLGLASAVYEGSILRGTPSSSSLLEALSRASEEGPVGRLPSLRTPAIEYLRDNLADFVAAGVVESLGWLAAGAAVLVLALAAGARRPELSKALLYLPVVGAGLLAVGSLLDVLGRDAFYGSLLAGPRTIDSFADRGASTTLIAAQLIFLVGRLTFGGALAIWSLNAMRVGLLTRFMGVLGILVGIMLGIGFFGESFSPVTTFWLVALGLLFLDRWPSGVPPAWRTGKAEPWPTNAERVARAGARTAGAETPAAPGGQPPGEARKKRKRRT